MASTESTMPSAERRKIFVSGLFDEVTKECLQDKFKNFGVVDKVKLRKNPTETTAEIYLTASQSEIARCFSILQNTKWKGKVLCLQLDYDKTDKKKEKVGKIDSNDNKLCNDDSSEKSKNIRQTFTIDNTENRYDSSNSLHSNNFRQISDLEKRLEASNSIWKDDYSQEDNLKDKYKLLRGAKIRHEKKVEPTVFTNEHNDDINKKTTFNNFERRNEKIATPDKKILDNEKRLRSIKNQRESFNTHKNIVKNALSQSLDTNFAKPKKIRFDDDGEIADTTNTKINSVSKTSSFQLFDEEEDSETDVAFKLKPQFDGPKGQQVFELQSRLGNDPRFQVDEDFIEEDAVEETSRESNEKNKNLEILEKVVGPLKRDNKKTVTLNPMIRYNPLQPDHKIYEISDQSSPAKKSKKDKAVVEPSPEPEVSKETYFQVEEGIKERFNPAKAEPFSLLKALGRVEENDDDNKLDDRPSSSEKTEVVVKYHVPKNFFNDGGGSDDELEKKLKTSDKKVNKKIDSNINGNDSFFFKKDDPRLSEGVSFFLCPESSEKMRAEWVKQRGSVVTAARIELKRIQRRKHPVMKLGNNARKFQHINKRKKAKKF